MAELLITRQIFMAHFPGDVKLTDGFHSCMGRTVSNMWKT